jgi:hypothetical protein
VIRDAVAVEKTFLREKSFLRLQPDLDDVQRGHEDRDEKGSGAGRGHLLVNGDVVLVERHFFVVLFITSSYLHSDLRFIIFYISSTVFCLLNFTQRSHYYKFRLVCYAFLLVSDFLSIFGSLIGFGQFVLLNESVQVGGFLLVLTLEVAVDAQVQLVPVLNLFVVNLKQVFQSWFSGSKRFNSNFSIKGFFSAN